MTDNDITVEILKDIRDDIHRLNDKVDEHAEAANARVDRMTEAMTRGFHGVHKRIDATNDRLDKTIDRLDNLRDITGESHRSLERRVSHLESRVERLE